MVLVLITITLYYEGGAGAREREITLTASARNIRISANHSGTASCSFIASSSFFIASSICEPNCPSTMFPNKTRSSPVMYLGKTRSDNRPWSSIAMSQTR
ncbi:hypothetical protein H4582DRAFT_1948672 [Lactarius indigo]|nr:hypothetical protein H4582DRAFT_1948672 [Lactarius indigo]